MMNRAMPVETNCPWRPSKRAKHDRHTAVDAQMGCCLVLASCPVKIGNSILAKYPEAIGTSRGHSHARSRGGRCHKEHVLLQEEVSVTGLDSRRSLIHASCLLSWRKTPSTRDADVWRTPRARVSGNSIPILDCSARLSSLMRTDHALCLLSYRTSIDRRLQ